MAFQDIELSKENSCVIGKLFSQKKLDKMWEFVDSLALQKSNVKEMELVFTNKNIVIRLWKI